MTAETLTREEVLEDLSYDPMTGIFLRKLKIGPRPASRITSAGYVQIMVKAQRHLAHRLAWLCVYGEWPSRKLDHKNHIRNDNRIDNLRLATPTENNKNRRLSKNNVSGHHGVSWHKGLGLWQANIGVGRKALYLGVFSSLDEAISVRRKAEVEYGFHPNHGSGRAEYATQKRGKAAARLVVSC